MRVACITVFPVLIWSAAIWWILIPSSPPAPISRENFDRTQIGMPFEDVRQILEEDGSDITGESVITVGIDGKVVPAIYGDRLMVWGHPPFSIWIGFDKDRVVSKYFRVNRLL